MSIAEKMRELVIKNHEAYKKHIKNPTYENLLVLIEMESVGGKWDLLVHELDFSEEVSDKLKENGFKISLDWVLRDHYKISWSQ